MRSRFPTALVAMTILLMATISCADELKPPVRELFVPFENLNVILDAGGRRVFLTRKEYDDLRRRARITDEAVAPHAYALTSAEYNVTVEEERAIITGNIFIDVTQDGLHAIPLPLNGVGLRKATLDGEPAAIGRPQTGAPSALFVSGVGQHKLALEIVAPIEVAAPRQILRFQLPHAATGRMRLTVPGDVEVKSGATVLRREFGGICDEFRTIRRGREGVFRAVVLRRQIRRSAHRASLGEIRDRVVSVDRITVGVHILV